MIPRQTPIEDVIKLIISKCAQKKYHSDFTFSNHDDSIDFIYSIAEAFEWPMFNKKDANAAYRRIRKAANYLVDCGVLERYRQSNYDLETRNEAKWQYSYQLTSNIHNRLYVKPVLKKEGFREVYIDASVNEFELKLLMKRIM